MAKKYHYFYKITNNLNGHYYYGVHNTDNIDDGYMGSGKRLRFAYQKYGINNFNKEILKFFDTSEEAYQYESNVVTEELVLNEDCYNLTVGGKNMDTTGKAVVVDNKGNKFLIDIDDKKYIEGVVSGATVGTVLVKGNSGDVKRLPKNDTSYLNGDYTPFMKGKVLVKDTNGNFYMVDVEDERYVKGELKHYWNGKKHKQETIKKIKNTLKNIEHQKGSKNSQFGTLWVNKNGVTKKIKKDEMLLYQEEGWKPGRCLSTEQKRKMGRK